MTLSVDHGAAAVAACFTARGEAPPQCSARLLEAPNGERLVVEYALAAGETASGMQPAAVIGKCYADGTGARTFRVMREVQAALAGAGPLPLTIPEPLWYDAQRRCLVQEKVLGQPLAEVAVGAEATHTFALAGEALAALHVLKLPPERPRRLLDHVQELMRPHPLVLAEALPAWRGRIRRLLDTMADGELRFAGEVTPVPLHRDFHLRQMFLVDRHIALIDWDLFAFGDPALDVGNFVMVLRTRLGPRATPSIQAFADGYRRRGSREVVERAGIYEALNYLRRACKYCRLGGDAWRERSEEMLVAAEAALESNRQGAGIK
ncbi:MAG: aminoglycoside phosphotransferase family protein [Dechloromonas sp.]|nr:aminoglycoside phosphotransferase family protein [Dechloromonas sp.]